MSKIIITLRVFGEREICYYLVVGLEMLLLCNKNMSITLVVVIILYSSAVCLQTHDNKLRFCPFYAGI